MDSINFADPVHMDELCRLVEQGLSMNEQQALVAQYMEWETQQMQMGQQIDSRFRQIVPLYRFITSSGAV
jgi:hypothetical protein